jgi:filamentous hemagglutinin family protein
MNTNVKLKSSFAVKPLAVAMALAFSAVAAYAAPTPNQMPGAGKVTAVNVGTVQVNSVNVSTITGLVSGDTLGLTGSTPAQAVITWGGAGAPADAVNPAGFNIGSGAQLNVTSASVGSALLNIDASGNPSQIFGKLQADANTAIFVSNTNGIIVAAGARIAAPAGVGLIGADLNNATAIQDFVANNSAAKSYLDVTGGQASVIIGGAINGSLTTNTPASYILLAGGNVTNTGNLFGNQVDVAAGMRAAQTLATVNGVASTPVKRLWNVTSGNSAVDGNLGTAAGNVEIASAGSSFVNTGSISAVGGWIGIEASDSIRSGTAGDTSLLTGLYADAGIVLDTFSATGKTELYNVVKGYTTGVTLPFLYINQQIGATGAVTINALTPGSAPSSITTTGDVRINGTDVAINSTINHKNWVVDGISTGDNLIINGSKSVSITADVGAMTDVSISSAGTINITGNVTSDTNDGGSGKIVITNTGAGESTTISGKLTSYGDGDGIHVTANGPLTISGAVNAINADVAIVNNGMASGNTTTISGAVTGNYGISIANNGVTNSNLNISGDLVSHNNGGITVNSNGNLQLGKATSTGTGYDDIRITANGLNVSLNGALTADEKIAITAQHATTKALPAAVITAPFVTLDVLNFNGVNASGNAYASAAEQPAAQIVTNNLDVTARGSVNAPIAGNTNWLNNAMVVKALDVTAPINASITANGAGFQAINLKFDGNAVVDSGDTYTPFIGVGLTTGTYPAGSLIGNGGSQMILNATGNMDVVSGHYRGFQFPGGLVFKAGGLLSVMGPVYNAWTTVAQPYQGVFFEAPTINALSFIATNGNSWANWSTRPTTGVPTIYQINQPTATTFNFVPSPSAAHQNTYSSLIMGGPVNFAVLN